MINSADSEGQESSSPVFHALLPDRRRSLDYGLRPRSHDRELVPKASSLIESNFLIRQLYKDCY